MMTYRLQKEISRLNKQFAEMSSEIENILELVVDSVKTVDSDKARMVVVLDKAIDVMEVEFEEECLKTLALYQPVATDLRFIVALLKINNDIERIGDLASNIAKRVIFLSALNAPKWPFDIEKMTTLMLSMYKDTIEALEMFDIPLAYDVLKQDEDVDYIHKKMYKSLANIIKKSDDSATDALIAMSSISRYIERIADHMTNIAEDIIYINDGQIIRHQN